LHPEVAEALFMGELNEQRWAVLSERGCEALGLSYNDAHLMLRALMREKVSGLCIITDDAARRASRTETLQSRQSNSNGSRSAIRKP
jgi:hypothetical protein